MSRNEYRAESTSEINKIKAELIKNAYKRVKRAKLNGFHIEAVALLESLITDRLESLISLNSNEKIKVGNLGPALIKSFEMGLIHQDFLDEVKNWSRNRAKVVHEMVKVTVVVDSDWTERMRFARETAEEGQKILLRVDSLVKKAKNSKH